MTEAPLLELRGVTRRYPGVTALDRVDLSVRAGEVHALVGENGAGKSTLLRVMAGAISPDAGELRLDGRAVAFAGPRDALARGITVIYQELTLVPQLPVAENVFLGIEPVRGGLVDRARLRTATARALAELGLEVDPSLPVARLSVARRQMVEMARALVRNARVLALDEPTATLTPHETARLFACVERLRSAGVGIVFVSHRLEEVRRLADRVTVLRDGAMVWTGPAAEKDDAALVRAMVGRDVEYPRRPAARPPEEPPALEVRELSREPAFRGVSLRLRRGEIVGLAGLVGAGRTELARVLAGAERAGAGTMTLAGAPYRPRSPREAIRRGVVYFPEDRQRAGLVPRLTVGENVTLSALDRFTRLGLVRRPAERRAAGAAVRDADVRPPDLGREARTLSGGNQQKVVVARGLLARARVLLFDEPTRGVDIGAKAELHRQIRALADEGRAVLVISSELPELLALADRLVVLREGQVTGALEGEAMTPERVMGLAVAG